MRPRHKVLYLFLSHLGFDLATANAQTREAALQAIQIAQLAGAPLGYHFGWGHKRPHSQSCAADFHSLLAAIEDDPTEIPQNRLFENYVAALSNVRAVLDDHSPLATRNEWTMRLSDVAFLLCVSGMTPEHCRDSLVRQNCYSDAEVREAEAALAGLGLLEKARKSA